MARRSFLEIDTHQIEGLADRLGELDPQRFGEGNRRAVNEVAERFEPKAREAIVATVNLSDDYLKQRMGVRLATSNSQPEAVIFARFRQTPLGRYDPRQLTQSAKNPKRAKGDPSRGIPAGRKQAGVSVEVTRGNRKTIGNGFLMPLRNGNGIGVFTRDQGAARFQHRLGPAVYQLVRVQADRLYEETADELQAAVIAEAEKVLEDTIR